MLNTYVDELFELVQKINKRKLNVYKMQLAIAQNPHVKDPNVLWNELKAQETTADGKEAKKPEFDLAGFEMFKSRLSANPRIVVKS